MTAMVKETYTLRLLPKDVERSERIAEKMGMPTRTFWRWLIESALDSAEQMRIGPSEHKELEEQKTVS
jgi:predicted DNA-binding protein